MRFRRIAIIAVCSTQLSCQIDPHIDDQGMWARGVGEIPIAIVAFAVATAMNR